MGIILSGSCLQGPGRTQEKHQPQGPISGQDTELDSSIALKKKTRDTFELWLGNTARSQCCKNRISEECDVKIAVEEMRKRLRNSSAIGEEDGEGKQRLSCPDLLASRELASLKAQGLWGRDKLGVWDLQIHTSVYKIGKQKGPTVQHRGLYSISCNNLWQKRI